jgi:hypothetical protein
VGCSSVIVSMAEIPALGGLGAAGRKTVAKG